MAMPATLSRERHGVAGHWTPERTGPLGSRRGLGPRTCCSTSTAATAAGCASASRARCARRSAPGGCARATACRPRARSPPSWAARGGSWSRPTPSSPPRAGSWRARGSGTRVRGAPARRPRRAPARRPARSPAPARTTSARACPTSSPFPRAAGCAACGARCATAPDRRLGYPDPRGRPALRAALAAYLGARRAASRADPGATSSSPPASRRASACSCRALRARAARGRIAVEDPGFHAAPRIARARRPRAGRRCRSTRDGLRVDALARRGAPTRCSSRPRTSSRPARCCAAERRAALLAWARERRRGWSIEDDYDAEYRYDREPVGALQGLAPERVVYAGSASKTLAPALRLGWLVAAGALARRGRAAKAARRPRRRRRSTSSRSPTCSRAASSTATCAARAASTAAAATRCVDALARDLPGARVQRRRRRPARARAAAAGHRRGGGRRRAPRERGVAVTPLSASSRAPSRAGPAPGPRLRAAQRAGDRGRRQTSVHRG